MSLARALGVIWTVLTPAQRRRCVLLQFVSALMAVSTVAGLAAVMTFLAMLADPLLVDRHAALRWGWQMLGTTKREFLLVLGAGFILLLVGSALLNVFGARAAGRFFFTVGDRVREVLFGEYLRRDYHFHMRTGTAQLMDNVLYQTDRLTMALLNGQLLITNAVLTLLVITSIAVVSPWVALAGALGIGGSYFLFFRFVRRRIERNGRLQSRQGAERIAVVEQAFLGIKQVIIARAQPFLSRRFAAVMRTLTQAAADTQFLGQAPRFVLECLAGAALIACAAFVSGGSAGSAWLAQLGFIGFAGFRLLPAIQQMYYALVIVRGQRTAIESLAAQLENREPDTQAPKPRWPARPPALRRGIELGGVSFRYAPGAPLILDEVALRIPAGAAIGIMGVSGCGKTTLVDLILGLLPPTAGRIEIDGVPLDPLRVPDWQQCLGYVPQEVMIVDGTVRENIAFGVDTELIDDTRVRQAAAQAGAGEFIEALPGGYHAKISGTGRDLSGGQRQRIAIARALYSDPSLLILDEATNSLDPETERAVVEAVIHNRGSRTLVVVAHGSAMLAACDRVYELRGCKLHECAVLRPVEPLARARYRGE